MDIKVPALGENITSAEVTRVLVKAGDPVAVDQALIELETGKATMELPSPAAGRVGEVRVKPGDQVNVGQTILTLETAAAVIPPEPASAPVPVPEIHSEVDRASDLASVAPLAPAAALSPPPAAAPPAPPSTPPAAAGRRVPVAAAPSVRQLARELGVEIHDVKGTGPGGRIAEGDVKAHAKKLIVSAPAEPPAAAVSGLPQIPLPDFARWGAIVREPMSTVRRVTAGYLTAAWLTIPHVTQHDRAEITELENLRQRFAARAEKAGAKLTLTAILLKVVAAALKVYPKFNASLDLARQEIVHKQYYHLGVAVDTARGLLVPVIRNVDQKNILQLAVELGQLAAKARAGKLGPDELGGGTFTVTNLGGIGGSFFTPIINAPEVAILGVGRALMEPTCGGQDQLCRPRLMLPLSLSYDHRLIDGADGARFLRWIIEAIEEPLLISLEG